MNLNKYWQIFQKFYKRDRYRIMGLEINPEFIKLLKIKTNVTPNKVENMAIMPMPAGAIINDQMKDLPLIAQTIKKIVKHSRVKTQNVAIAIPKSWTITKNIIVNAHMTKDELESRVWIEADRLFSSLIGEIYLDFSVIGPAQQDPSQLEVLIVASRKDQINPFFEIMRLADLNLKIIDVSCYAIERALSLTAQSVIQAQTIALLNIDSSLMSLLVLDKGQLIYASDQAYEGSYLRKTQPAETELVTTESSATDETNVLSEDLPKEEEGVQASTIAYIKHMLHFFYSSRPNIKINQVILAGDCATKPNLAQAIQKEIGIETQLINPFEHMDIGPGINAEELKRQSAALTLCCGLALSELK